MNKELLEQSKELYEQLRLLESFRKLGPNARRVLLALAERLVKGIEHGDFDKPHDWDKESSEEALDLAVYQAAKLLGLGKAAEPEELYTFGHEFVGGRHYTRFHEGPSHNPRVTLVDAAGRTPDGMPWVPPVGARVRVVHRFFNVEPNVGEVLIVRRAHADKADPVNMIAIDVSGHGWINCRVVPA